MKWIKNTSDLRDQLIYKKIEPDLKLVWCRNGDFRMARYDGCEDGWSTDSGEHLANEFITHWCIVKKPKKGNIKK